MRGLAFPPSGELAASARPPSRVANGQPWPPVNGAPWTRGVGETGLGGRKGFASVGCYCRRPRRSVSEARPMPPSRSSPAPDRGLAAAPVEERAFLVLHPLRAARPPLCRAAEGRRDTADVGAG